MSNKLKILLIGPMPPPIGGATVLFKQLVDELELTDVDVKVINTAGGKGLLQFLTRMLSIGFNILVNISRVDVVSFHSSVSGAYKVGILVRLLCILFGKKWSFRGFGGNYNKWYEHTNAFNRYIFNKTVLSANLVLFETKECVEYFKTKTKSPVRWYPNSRKINYDYLNSDKSEQALKYIFLGHVKETKGVKLILDIANELPDDVTVDIYGPLLDGMTENSFINNKARYCGSLAPEDVMATLVKYDVLLFPTFYEGEGYPGVILEAYSCGLPVVTTLWRNIPEIVDRSSGVLIEPMNSQALKLSILDLRNSNADYSALCSGVKLKINEFSSDVWSKAFVDMHNNL